MARPTVDELLQLIRARDRDALIEAATTTAETVGIDVLVGVLGEVQREVGTLWHRQRWSVADEHAATAMIDLALAAGALAVMTPTPALSEVVVTCAEEEWHVLPARMLAELLRARGWDVTFLGASTPADHLRAYLSKHPPTAVAISCSIPIYLQGARRSISASHDAGVPALVGGEAFGKNERRARAIGADGWAAGADDAHILLSSWLTSSPPLSEPSPDNGEDLLLAAQRQQIVDDAMIVLADGFPPLATYSTWQLSKTREDLDYILRFVEAALLTGDDNIVIDLAHWLIQLLDALGLPSGIVPLSARCLLSCMPSTLSSAQRLLDLIARAAEGIEWATE